MNVNRKNSEVQASARFARNNTSLSSALVAPPPPPPPLESSSPNPIALGQGPGGNFPHNSNFYNLPTSGESPQQLWGTPSHVPYRNNWTFPTQNQGHPKYW